MRSSEALRIARYEVGYVESPPHSNKTKYGEWFGLNGQPWCCIFIQYVFRNTGLLMRTGSCTQLYKSMKSKGQVVTAPKAGDLVFFNFDSAVKCETMKHIGIVEVVNSDGSIVTIEGNTSQAGSQENGGAVCRKSRKSHIMAYCRPAYTDAISANTVTKSVIKRGSSGSDVIYLQFRLQIHGYKNVVADGSFGPVTEQAVKQFQAKNKLVADGIVGEKTWQAIG